VRAFARSFERVGRVRFPPRRDRFRVRVSARPRDRVF